MSVHDDDIRVYLGAIVVLWVLPFEAFVVHIFTAVYALVRTAKKTNHDMPLLETFLLLVPALSQF